MTFDEANNKLDEALDLVDYTFLPERLDEILKNLKQEYAPTVEMTKNDRDILLYNLSNYSFDVFLVSVAISDKEKFGLPKNKEFEGVSIDQLMQAWLHPETIKIIDEEK